MGAIDADAHVIETVQTWSYLEEAERRFTPQLMTQTFGEELLSNEGTAVRDFWVIEGRAHGKDRNVGTNTPLESREMQSVETRLAHMDDLGIETQVLYPTLFLRPVVQDAERERALCKSYNRWMGDLWRQGKGRLRWVVKPRRSTSSRAPAVVEMNWSGRRTTAAAASSCGGWNASGARRPLFLPALGDRRGSRSTGLHPFRERQLPPSRFLRRGHDFYQVQAGCRGRVPYASRKGDSEKVPKGPLGLRRGQRAMGTLCFERPGRPLQA